MSYTEAEIDAAMSDAAVTASMAQREAKSQEVTNLNNKITLINNQIALLNDELTRLTQAKTVSEGEFATIDQELKTNIKNTLKKNKK